MLRRGPVIAALGLLGPAALFMIPVFAGCDDEPVPQPCSDIPAGGCPIARGVSCFDPTCEAVYACRAGNRWELVERCPPQDASARPAFDASGEDSGTEPPFDASVDAPPGAYGGPGCLSLQSPDCSVGLVLSCGADCCDCEDLYVCEGGGWNLWGYCSPDGGVRPSR